MATVSALEPQQRDPERVNVYLDGRFGFGASSMLLLARGVTVGTVLAEEQIEELVHDDEVERAYGASLNFLSYRPRSRREIEEYLRRRKVTPSAVEPVVQRLERVGLVNDGEFARFWVENRQAFRPRGTRALRMELRQKGLEGEIIDEALAQVGDEADAAYEAGMKKARSYAGLEEREFFRKMVGFLQRRGFPYEVSAGAARRIYGEMSGETPEWEEEE